MRVVSVRPSAACWRCFSPVALILLAGIAQLVEHNLAKVGVAGSSPVSRLVLLGVSVAQHRWLVLFRSGGETGRREGLKIPWDKLPCGFDPRPEHSENDDSDMFVRWLVLHGRRVA